MSLHKNSIHKPRKVVDLVKEYSFDYSKAKPNHFVSRMKDAPLVAVIDPDVAKAKPATKKVKGKK